jgi:UPF0755 protein
MENFFLKDQLFFYYIQPFVFVLLYLASKKFCKNKAAFNRDRFIELCTDTSFINSLLLPIETESLEGFLFPDKYLVPVTSTEEDLIKIMTETFTGKIEELGEVTYEDIILASLIEREGRNAEERKMISDIMKRRLEEGWFLNIDATLLYYHGDWSYELTVQDLKEDQPYNTYVRMGLTPTPICNPGMDSLDAAMNPNSNEYYYYIHDDNGNIHYAKTLAEHNTNINTYLR